MLNSSLSTYEGYDSDPFTPVKPSAAVRFITVILWASTIVVGVIGNTLLSLTIGCSSSLRTAMNTYVLSIGMVDFMTCALLLPMRLVIEREAWLDREAPDVLYGAELFIRTFTDVTRLFLMQSLSIERYQAIARPFSVSKIQARKRALAIIGVIWAVSAVISGLSVRYFCDTVLHLRRVDNGNNPDSWGDLEVFVELPLTFLSVFAISISYGLIVMVLRQQRKKMNRHSKPKVKVNQVAPVTEDKRLGSPSRSGAIVTLLTSDGEKGCNLESGITSSLKGHNRKIAPCIQEKTDTVKVEKGGNISELCKSQDKKNINKGIKPRIGTPTVSMTEDTVFQVTELEHTAAIGTDKKSDTHESKESKAVIEGSDDINFQHGCNYIKTYDKSLEDVHEQYKHKANGSQNEENITDYNLPSTDISMNNCQAHPAPTRSVPLHENLNIKSPFAKDQALPAIEDTASGTDSVSSTGMNKFSALCHSPHAKMMPCSTVKLKQKLKRNSTGIHAECDRAGSKMSLQKAGTKIKLRSFSFPLLVSYKNDAFVCNETASETILPSSAKEGTDAKHPGPQQRPSLVRAYTDKPFFRRSESLSSAPHFSLINATKTGSNDFPVEEHKDNYFKEIELTDVKDTRDDVIDKEKIKNCIESDEDTNSTITSLKISTPELAIKDPDRKISLESEIQNDAVDKDAISLRFHQQMILDNKQELETPKKQNIFHGSDNNSMDSSLMEQPSCPDICPTLNKTSSEVAVQKHESIPCEVDSNPSAQEEFLQKSDRLAATSISGTGESHCEGKTDLPQKETTLGSTNVDVTQKKTSGAAETLAVPGSSAKHVEIVEMDGSVHVEVIKNEATAAPIEGAVCLMNPRNKEHGRRRVEFKAALKVGFLFCCFVCLWMPLPIFVFVMRESSEWGNTIQIHLLSIFSALATSTAAVDPIIYGLLNRQIRSALQLGVRKIKRKLSSYCTNVA